MTESRRKFLPAILALAVVLACGLSQNLRAADDNTAQIEKLFREGVDLYAQGKWSDSSRRFKEVLALDPRKELAARLIDEAGTHTMAKIMADPKMGSEPTYIWALYKKYYVGKLADKERMTKMAQRLVDSNTSEDERAMLYREFGELSHYAVPALAVYLKDATHEDFRTYARIAIARMGHRAVLPVIELLKHKDQLMRENATLVLSDIQPADPRSIPALKELFENTKESATARRFAERTLQKITGLPTASWKSSAQYYYDAANRYYLDRAGVAEEGESVDGMTWHLNGEGDLVSVQYPLWAWNEQMAEESALRGMAAHPEFTEFYPLWACIQAAAVSEVKDLMDVVNEQPSRHTFTAEEKKDLEDWSKKLVDSTRLIAAVGREFCNSALNKVHSDVKRYPGHLRLPQVGATLAKELANLDPRGELLGDGLTEPAATPSASGSEPAVPVEVPAALVPALVAGLDSREMAIQYQCALSLAQINRFPQQWNGSAGVAKILGRGLSENKSLQILLVEENPNAANELRQKFAALGFDTTVAVSGRDALISARSFPPKDIAIISDSLRRDLTADQLIEEMRADVRTRYLSSGILHPRAERGAIQSRFGTDIPLVEREASGNDLKVAVDKIAERRAAESVTKRKAHEVAVACGNALAKLDPRATHITLNDAVNHAILALVNRPDDVRNPAAVFLGRTEGGAMKDDAAAKLRAVFEDANNAVELRRNALRSLGRVKLDGMEAVYVKSQAEADQELKDIGAEAFGQKSRDPKAISDFVHAQRIDKDKKEK